MKKSILSLIIFLSFFSTVRAEIVEKVVAVVDGEVITLSELEEFLGPLRARMEGVDVDIGSEEARRRALEQLIESRILLQEAKDRGIEIKEERVSQIIEEARGSFASEEEFRQALDEGNLTEAKLGTRFEEDLMVKELVGWEVSSKVRVGGEDVRKFYEENKKRFVDPEEVELSQIWIKKEEGDSWRELEQKGESLLRKLGEGADFSLLARENSYGPNAERGGNLGFLTPGELSPEFEEAVSTLEIGEISGLIKMGDGIHIIKLEGRKAARQMELSEVRNRIESLIFAEKAKRRYREWVGELKKKTYIEIK